MGRALEQRSATPQPDGASPTEATPTYGKRIVTGLTRDINFEDFAKAVGGKIEQDGVRFEADFGWSGSLRWQDTYEKPVPNPYFSDTAPRTRTVRRRNLRFSASFWDGGYDSDGREIDRNFFEKMGYVLVIGRPDESFAAFVNPATKRDTAISGIVVTKDGVRNFGGFVDMFSKEFQKAAQPPTK